MRVIIVGGGVIGLWCARNLLRAGAEVTVLDRSEDTAVATPASAGWVVPALSSPLSGPGVVASSVGQLLRREAAFSVRSTPSPQLARWLWSFVRSGREPQFRQGLRATLELAGSCLEEYAALKASGVEFEQHQEGLLMVAQSEHGLDEATGLVENAAAAGYNGKYDLLDSAQLTHLEPSLIDGLRGGVHARDEIHVHPGQLLSALRDDVQNAGGVLREDASAHAIVPATGNRWTVLTSDERFTGNKIVVAAGYWSKALLETLGVRVPLESAAGYSLTATGPAPPSLPLKLVEANVAVTPLDGGVRLAGRFALGSVPTAMSSRQVERVVAAAIPYFRGWRPTSVSARHIGLRPVTPDSLPLIGEVPASPGVLAATGHGMLGLTLAPGTAAEVTHQVMTGRPTAVGSAFDVARFNG